MRTASYIVGAIGITAFLAAYAIRALRRAGELLNNLIAEIGDVNDIDFGDEEDASC